MVQPALWLLIFGTTFSHLHVINTGSVSYLAFLAPGHHRPVGAVHLDLLRHPDHLGSRRRHPRQTDGDTGARVGTDHRQGIRGRRAIGRSGHRRAGAGLSDGHRPDHQPAADPGGDGRRHARCRVLRLPVDDAGRTGAQPRSADGDRPGHHDAVVLRFQCAVPRRRDARLAACAEHGQPTQLRGQRPAGTVDRHAAWTRWTSSCWWRRR